jgi:aryl-alcohol dehydrogenase-like predicted oxidoreductase
MRHRQLGTSGLTVSVVGLGGDNFGRRCDLEGTRAVVDAALEAGITLLDTADVYGNRGGSETFLGQVLKGRRDQVVLATKFGQRMDGPEEEAPGSRRYIRYAGSSNYAGWQIADADWIARGERRARMISAQNRYSLLERGVEQEVIPACLAHGIGMLPFFPLANGLLTGKYHRGERAPRGTRLAERPALLTDAAFDRVEALEKYAAERGVTLLEVAVGGLAAQPAVASVIAGATRPEQVRANAAAGAWEPSATDLAALDEIAPRGTGTR